MRHDKVLTNTADTECCALEALMGNVFIGAFLAIACYSLFRLVPSGGEALPWLIY